MTRSRSLIRNLGEYLVVRLVVGAIEIAPLAIAGRIAQLCSRALDVVVPRLRRVARKNLSIAIPELDSSARDKVITGVFTSVGRVLLAFSRFPHIDRTNVGEWIRYEGFDHVERALARGKGVLFATGHFGNWELSAFAFGLLTFPMHVVVRPLDNPMIDRFVEYRRALSGNLVMAKRSTARGILKALRANAAVGILVDQNDSQGIFVDFFGKPACTSAGIVRLAETTGAAIVPGFALWDHKERSFVLRFSPELLLTGSLERDLQHLHTLLSEVIREYPDQWLWIHRRWKTQPGKGD